jgi:hypothetical protein
MMTRLETVLQENHCHMYDDSPMDKLANSIDGFIDEAVGDWYYGYLTCCDTDKKLIVNDLTTEMSFMVHRFQERLEDLIDQFGKEAK